MKRLFAAAALLAALTAPVSAEQTPLRATLTNGIPVTIQDTYAAPTVSLNIFIRVGSVFESASQNGLSHFYEHMFFRGTPTRSGLEFKRQIEALGGTTNANTSKDFTHFYINLPKQYLNEGLELLADAYLHAECSQESVDAERKVVLEEWRIGKANQLGEYVDRLTSEVYKKSPYGRSVIGTENTIKHLMRADLLNWKKTYYVPGRTGLVIVGEVDRQETLAKIQALFGSYQAPAPPELKIPLEEPPAKTVVIDQKAKNTQSLLLFGYLGPSVKDVPDVYRLDLLTFMLGVGKHSLLGLEFNDKEDQKPQEAQLEYLTQPYQGMISLMVNAQPGKEDETVGRVDKVLNAAMAGNFTDQDVHRARVMLRNSYSFGAESNSGKADNLGFFQTIDTVDFALNYLKNVEQVTRADLIDCAKKYFGRPHYRLIVKGTAPKKGDY